MSGAPVRMCHFASRFGSRFGLTNMRGGSKSVYVHWSVLQIRHANWRVDE